MKYYPPPPCNACTLFLRAPIQLKRNLVNLILNAENFIQESDTNLFKMIVLLLLSFLHFRKYLRCFMCMRNVKRYCLALVWSCLIESICFGVRLNKQKVEKRWVNLQAPSTDCSSRLHVNRTLTSWIGFFIPRMRTFSIGVGETG